ncbi:hypothetical protein [Sediminicurvatus halobius]|uniref:Uncharacterized protein n=1 Tax=Sediminicurvatus halobius TaxID=2182432 RepID=A0A2U2N0R6_9GAMM|nr:hypothetical protein [Spiribacter halobius]PWG62835.1 hypothetical protein DEM34_10740 [Spiribacter halobius]UEX77015.1 hypothetical protein LMH63_13815 [Spiribacter halobius]
MSPQAARQALSERRRVWYLDDIGRLHRCRLRREPWKLADGTWVVLVTGLSGGVLLDRVTLRGAG